MKPPSLLFICAVAISLGTTTASQGMRRRGSWPLLSNATAATLTPENKAASAILDLTALHLVRELPKLAAQAGTEQSLNASAGILARLSREGSNLVSTGVKDGINMAIKAILVHTTVKALDFVYEQLTRDKTEAAKNNLLMAQKVLTDAENRIYTCEGCIQALKLQMLGAPALKKELIKKQIEEFEKEHLPLLKCEAVKKQAQKDKIELIYLELASKEG